MDTKKLIAAGLAFAMVSMAAPAMATGPGHGGNDDGGFGGLPDQALFGICTASGHAHDEASVAKPFQWLSSAMCEDAEHPGSADAAGGPPR